MENELLEIPEVEFSMDNIWDGSFPHVMAEAATRLGPVLKKTIPAQDGSSTEVFFLVGAEANKAVLHTYRACLSSEIGWLPVFGEFYGKSLISMDDPEHRKHRQVWAPAFTQNSIESYMPLILRLLDERSSEWKDGDVVDMYEEGRRITFDAAAIALANIHDEAQRNELYDGLYFMQYGFVTSGDAPEVFHTKALETKARLSVLFKQIIAARKSLDSSERPKDLLTSFIESADANSILMTDDDILAHFNLLLLTGSETTATLVGWIHYFLARYPDQVERLRDEAIRTFGEDGPIDMIKLRDMKLLENAIKEVERMSGPTINLPRTVTAPFEFGGYTFPIGTNIRLSVAAGHQLESAFADPGTFDPDRFGEGRQEDRKTPYAHIPYGAGAHACIGFNFARTEFKAILSVTLRKFKFELVENSPYVHVGFWNGLPYAGIRLKIRPYV